MYSTEDIKNLAQELLNQIPVTKIEQLHQNFEWAGKAKSDAIEERNKLEKDLSSAIKSSCSDNIVIAANKIHLWGFGSNIPSTLANCEAFKKDLTSAITIFAQDKPHTSQEHKLALTNLLSHPDIGIATASKWICFVNQSQYAIFDSRVSIALRYLTIKNNRAFPIIPRRTPKGANGTAWPASTTINSKPNRIANAYIDFLSLMQATKEIGNIESTAKIEMALFMHGDSWNTNKEKLKPLRKNAWCDE